MSLLDTLTNELLGPKSVNELSKSSNADSGQVKQLVSTALPLFLSAMYQNSETKEGAKSLESALNAHAADAQKSTSAMLSKADVSDGKKIVNHILGSEANGITKNLSASTGLTQSQVTNMLGQLAPVVLSLVGNYKNEGNDSQSSSTGNLLTVLGSAILGDKYNQGSSSKQGGINLTNLAGSLLNNLSGNSSGSSSNTGSLIGSLLGIGGNESAETTAKKTTTKKTGSSASSKKTTAKTAAAEEKSGTNLGSILMNLLK